MDPLHRVAGIFDCREVSGAFRELATALSRDLPLHAALCVVDDPPVVRHCWPGGVAVSRELVDTAAHVLRPEVFPLGSQFPADAARFGASEMLLLPLGRLDDGGSDALVLIADAGAFGPDLEPWGRMGVAFARVKHMIERVERAERQTRELRARVEESEALHTLGLATNRTLEPTEVMDLVARLARSLLGARCASVHILLEDRLRRTAAIGYAEADVGGECGDEQLARSTMEADRPLIVTRAGASDGATPPPPAGMHSALAVPLSLFGDTFGALVVGYGPGREPDARDSRLALTLAGHASVAITNARLHGRVQEHSRELASAYEQLRDVTAAKERFYNAVAHDLRTPVGAIKGYHELILEGMAGEMPEKARRFLARASRAGETLLLLVNDLMDFAKLEAGKVEIRVGDVEVDGLLEEALSVVAPQAGEKGLTLRRECEDGLPTVRTDGSRVRQILLNLLSNAVKFTEAGEVSLVATRRAGGEDEPEVLEIRVSDTGPGIPAPDRERIFMEFEQVSGSMGTGLGLPISRKLARLLQGDLRLESEAGVGCTFVLTLPLVVSGRTSSLDVAASSAPAEPPSTAARPASSRN